MFTKTSPVAAPPEAAPGRRFTDTSAIATRLGPGLHVRGTITGSEPVAIAGTFEGPVDVEGLVHICEGARVVGQVTAHDAVVEGQLEGELVVRGRVEMSAKARIRGEIAARTVAIAEGCAFDGRIHVGPEGAGGPTRFEEKRGRSETASEAQAGASATAGQPAPRPAP